MIDLLDHSQIDAERAERLNDRNAASSILLNPFADACLQTLQREYV
jgi:hypothetical protein